MKKINNIETNLPLNEWLKERKDDNDIVVKMRNKGITNQRSCKVKFGSILKDYPDEDYDIMEIWNFSEEQPKLLWKRGELISEEEFMKEYERVFDNDVDWEDKRALKWNIQFDTYDKEVRIYSSLGIQNIVRYCGNREKAENFAKKYEVEIKKYLFGIE